MSPEILIGLGSAFAAYLQLFEVCVAYRPTAEHLHAYCRGLLSELPRKCVEPIALWRRRRSASATSRAAVTWR